MRRTPKEIHGKQNLACMHNVPTCLFPDCLLRGSVRIPVHKSWIIWAGMASEKRV